MVHWEVTHHSLHDFAVLRAINNIIVVAPADNFETEQAIKLAAATQSTHLFAFWKKSNAVIERNK